MNSIEMKTEKSITPLSAKLDKDYEKIAFDLCKEQYPNIIKMAKLILTRTKNNYDNQVSVEGVTGSGKSMFTLTLVLVIHYMLRRVFRLTKQILFIPDEGEIKESIGGLKDLDVYWVDEAIRALDKKRWYNQDQIDLNHIVKTERRKRNTIFYNMQRFSEFTETFRNSNIFFRIIIIPRHAAVLRVFDIDPDVDDPWHTRETRSVKYGGAGRWRYKAVMSSVKRLEMEKKAINYQMFSYMPDLESHPDLNELWQYYDQLKLESRVNAYNREKEEGTSKGLNTYENRYKTNLLKVLTKLKEERNITYDTLKGEYGIDLARETIIRGIKGLSKLEKGDSKTPRLLRDSKNNKRYTLIENGAHTAQLEG